MPTYLPDLGPPEAPRQDRFARVADGGFAMQPAIYSNHDQAARPGVARGRVWRRWSRRIRASRSTCSCAPISPRRTMLLTIRAASLAVICLALTQTAGAQSEPSLRAQPQGGRGGAGGGGGRQSGPNSL